VVSPCICLEGQEIYENCHCMWPTNRVWNAKCRDCAVWLLATQLRFFFCGLERLRPCRILSKDISYVWNAKCQEDYWGPWGMFLHASVSCIPAQRKTERHVLREIATEALFLLVLALRSPEPNLFVSEDSRLLGRDDGSLDIFRCFGGTTSGSPSVSSLSGWRCVPSGALNVALDSVWRLYFSGSLIRVPVITGKAPHSTFQERKPSVK
jgi:hypothetical protein